MPPAMPVYQLHMYQGGFHVLPQSWRFPSDNAFSMWQQWWVGDLVHSIPPLKLLTGNDVIHLNRLAMVAGEARPRKARKILSNLRFLMGYIEGRVRAAHEWNPRHNIGTVNSMYNAVAHEFVILEDDPRNERRHPHLKWQTMVHFIRTRERVATR